MLHTTAGRVAAYRTHERGGAGPNQHRPSRSVQLANELTLSSLAAGATVHGSLALGVQTERGVHRANGLIQLA